VEANTNVEGLSLSMAQNIAIFEEAPLREKKSTDKDIVRSLTPIQLTQIKMGE